MFRRMIGAVVVFGICVGTLSAFEVLAARGHNHDFLLRIDVLEHGLELKRR